MGTKKTEAPSSSKKRKNGYSAEERERAMTRHQNAIDKAIAAAGPLNPRDRGELERRAVADSGGRDPLPEEHDEAQEK